MEIVFPVQTSGQYSPGTALVFLNKMYLLTASWEKIYPVLSSNVKLLGAFGSKECGVHESCSTFKGLQMFFYLSKPKTL